MNNEFRPHGFPAYLLELRALGQASSVEEGADGKTGRKGKQGEYKALVHSASPAGGGSSFGKGCGKPADLEGIHHFTARKYHLSEVDGPGDTPGKKQYGPGDVHQEG